MLAVGVGVSPVFGSFAAVLIPAAAIRQRDGAAIRDRSGALILTRT